MTQAQALLMTAAEARACAATIRACFKEARQLLLDFCDREGWSALGYATWDACVEGEFDEGRRALQYRLAAARVEQALCKNCTPPPPGVPDSHLLAVADLDPEDAAEVLTEAQATPGRATAATVAAIVERRADAVRREEADLEEAGEELTAAEDESGRAKKVASSWVRVRALERLAGLPWARPTTAEKVHLAGLRAWMARLEIATKLVV